MVYSCKILKHWLQRFGSHMLLKFDKISLKTAFFSIISYKNCVNFIKTKQKWPNLQRILDNSSISYSFLKFLTTKEILVKNEIFSHSKPAQTFPAPFSLKKGMVAKPFEPVIWNLAWKNRNSCAFRQFQ